MRASSELRTKRNANGVEVKAKVIKERGNTVEVGAGAGAGAGATVEVEVAAAVIAAVIAAADDTDILDIADITTEVFFEQTNDTFGARVEKNFAVCSV